jgi:hypothetical protein
VAFTTATCIVRGRRSGALWRALPQVETLKRYKRRACSRRRLAYQANVLLKPVINLTDDRSKHDGVLQSALEGLPKAMARVGSKYMVLEDIVLLSDHRWLQGISARPVAADQRVSEQ